MLPGALLDYLIAIEQTVPGVQRVYRLRPRGMPETPALVHLLPSGTLERDSTEIQKDTVAVVTRLVIPFSNDGPDDEGALLMQLTDAYLTVVDTKLWNDALPTGLVGQRRQGFTQTTDDFNGVPALCMDFRLQFELRRSVR